MNSFPESATSIIKGGNVCMLGGIYSDQRCPVCGGKFVNDGKKGLFCIEHPKVEATRFSVRFKGVHNRFDNYDEAHQCLEGLRFKYREGSFDVRDYKKDNPLGFETLIKKWLEVKEKTVKQKSYNNLKNYADRAIISFGNKNIKEIGYAELEDFLFSQKVSDKTRANIKSGLHDFWNWLLKRKIIKLWQVPEFPACGFELGYRKVIDKDTQWNILEEIKRISYHINPKIYLGVKWLCTYISVRPGEMVKLKEGDIDLGNGYLLFPHPKEKRPKAVPILDEDIEILRSFPSAIPSISFFRHTGGIQRVLEGEPFGEKYFYKWWVKACNNLSIEGVDLYGGTRHSSARALRKHRTPEEIKRATMHSTNKAFERYFQIESDDLRDIYQDSTPGKKLVKNLDHPKTAKILNLKG